RVFPTTSVNVGVAESTRGASAAVAETVMVSATDPTFSCTSIVAVWSAISAMLRCTYLANPLASTVSKYSVGRRDGTVYRPVSSVVIDRSKPVPLSVAVTRARGTADPDGSVTAPVMMPSACAHADDIPAANTNVQTILHASRAAQRSVMKSPCNPGITAHLSDYRP